MTLGDKLEEYASIVASWQALSKRQAQAVEKLRKVVAAGNLRDLEKLRVAARAATDAVSQQASVCVPLEFSASDYLSPGGGYIQELKEAAEQEGVRLYERDGMIFCYPVLVQLEPELSGVRIDKKVEYNIHPRVLALFLKKEQGKEPKTKSEQFIEALFKAYELVRDSDYKAAPVDIPLRKVYATLTLRPGSDKEYTLLDFTRDVYFLDRSGITATRKGHRMSLPASTASREAKGNILKFVARDGYEKLYAGIKFTAAIPGEHAR